jgi:hypothetical protein
MVRRSIATLSALAALTACSGGDCTQGVFPSVSATVVDATTQANLATITTGTISLGSWYSAAFERFGDVLLAGQNRSGNLTVALTAPGYQAWTDRVFVESDGCSVLTEEIRVELEPT